MEMKFGSKWLKKTGVGGGAAK
ncbi:hypothetical protein A2U01_0098726, partial [Trifolium medium]|nr:hypothetical protein [Trifolium medium]